MFCLVTRAGGSYADVHFNGFYFETDADGQAIDFALTTVGIATRVGVTSFSYQYDGPQVPDDTTPIEADNLGTEIYNLSVNHGAHRQLGRRAL